jgi:hypothetical protein
MDVRNSSEEPSVFWEAYRQIQGDGQIQGDVAQSIQITFHFPSFPIAIADVLKRSLIILNYIPPSLTPEISAGYQPSAGMSG